MKYFTADLYERFNSRDVDVADRADDQWKKAEVRYEARLQRIRGSLPAVVRELADKLCLHDAEVMAIGETRGRASIVAKQRDKLYWLSYGLTSKVESKGPRRSTTFFGGPAYWLYDEVDMPAADHFVHRILLRDGREITLKFDSFEYRVLQVRGEETHGALAEVPARSNGHEFDRLRPTVKRSKSTSRGAESKKRSAKRRG